MVGPVRSVCEFPISERKVSVKNLQEGNKGQATRERENERTRERGGTKEEPKALTEGEGGTGEQVRRGLKLERKRPGGGVLEDKWIAL